MKKVSKLEFVSLFLAALFLAFTAGWFLRGAGQAQPVRVETRRTLGQEELTVALPSPSPAPSETPDPLVEGGKINLNTAGLEELTLLPGIGEKKAQSILDYRAENGPFRIPEDITRVSGIGEGTLEDIIDYITTEDEA